MINYKYGNFFKSGSGKGQKSIKKKIVEIPLWIAEIRLRIFFSRYNHLDTNGYVGG